MEKEREIERAMEVAREGAGDISVPRKWKIKEFMRKAPLTEKNAG